MRIGLRIAGGFVLTMLLTAVVAVVGWTGLRSYSVHVATSSLAQMLVRDIGRLNLDTEQVVQGAPPRLASDALRKVKSETARLMARSGPDDVDADSSNDLLSSLASYEQSMSIFVTDDAIKTRKHLERADVAGQLIAVTRQVSLLQASQFDSAIGALTDTAIDLKVRAAILEVGLQLQDALSGLAADTTRYLARRDQGSRNALLLLLNAVDTSLDDAALRLPSNNQIEPVRLAARTYRLMLGAPRQAPDADLLAASDKLQFAGNILFAKFDAGILDTVDNLNAARDQAAASSAARQAAQAIIAVSQQVGSAEAKFLRNGDGAAADEVRRDTATMTSLVEAVATNVPDASLQRMFARLRLRISTYDRDFEAIVSAQEAQVWLLRRIRSSMDSMLAAADRLDEDQLRRMAEERRAANRLIYGGTVMALLISIVLSAVITRSITRPLGSIVAVMRRLADGELVAAIPGGGRRDELADVARAVTIFRDNAVAMDGLTQKLDRARLQQLADVSFEGILIHDKGVILNVNEAICLLLRRSRADLINHDLREFAAASDHEWIKRSEEPSANETIIGEVELFDRGGRAIPTEFHARRIDYSLRPATAVAVRDLTSRRQAEAKLVHLARHDPLTGLPNRFFFRERLAQALETAEREGLAVLCLDLNRFKAVNDQLGHAAGDDLLTEVSRRLSSMMRSGDTAARLGGDEFAIILVGPEPTKHATHLCDQIITRLAEPFAIRGRQVVIGASIGVALHPAHGVDGPALMRSADIAMYCAKADGRSISKLYDTELDERLRERHALENDLRQALDRCELELHYQPLVCCRTGHVTGFEALSRWTHPQRGPVSPHDFILVAEQTGQIDRLGLWALQTACAEAASWASGLDIAVNLSPVQFRQADLPRQVAEILSRTGLPAERLVIEVTEGVLIDDTDLALSSLTEIKRLGVHISLDDFGTGYSSFNYLQRFPFDKIKIDKSFISALGQTRESIAIVRAIIALAGGLGLSIVAEGVETRHQRRILEEEGCTLLQGYLLGRPMPRTALPALVAADEEIVG